MVVNKYKDYYEIDIMRPTKWGNEFIIGRDGSRKEVISKHKRQTLDKIYNGELSIEELLELDGKILGCCCKPKSCHGDNYIQLIEYFKSNFFTKDWCNPMGYTLYDYLPTRTQDKLDKIQDKKRKILISLGKDQKFNFLIQPIYKKYTKVKYKNQKLVTGLGFLPRDLSDTPISKLFNPYKFITLYGTLVKVRQDEIFMFSDMKAAKKKGEKLSYPSLSQSVVSSGMFARGVITTPPHLTAMSHKDLDSKQNKKMAKYIYQVADILKLDLDCVAIVDSTSRERLITF